MVHRKRRIDPHSQIAPDYTLLCVIVNSSSQIPQIPPPLTVKIAG